VQSGGIRALSGLSNASYSHHSVASIPRVPLNGTFHSDSTPPSIVSVTAVDTGGSHGFTSGDSILLQFSVPLNVSAGDTADPPVFRTQPELPGSVAVTMRWGPDSQSALLTFVSTSGISLELNDTTNALLVSIPASLPSNLLVYSLDKASLPCDSSVALSGGSWGIVPTDITNTVLDVDTFTVSIPVTFDARIQDQRPTAFKVTLLQDCAAAGATASNTGSASVIVPVPADVNPVVMNLSRSSLLDTSTCTRTRVQVSAYDGYTKVFGGAAAAFPPVLCFARSVVTTPVNPLPLNTAGGQTVLFLGSDLCDTSAIVTARYGNGEFTFQAPTCAVVSSPAGLLLSCASAKGVGSAHRWTATVNGLEGIASEPMTSYAPPVVQQVQGVNLTCLQTSGGSRVAIVGSNFGELPAGIRSVKYTGRSDGQLVEAANCTLVVDHVKIECDAVPGNGDSLRWSVNVAGLVSNPPSTTYL
jgi:hypothetical protein